jgi:hypothetical protein
VKIPQVSQRKTPAAIGLGDKERRVKNREMSSAAFFESISYPYVLRRISGY